MRLEDVAQAAGVSLATVDRVLNNRPGVREKTIQKVRDAVEQLAYRPDPAAARLARPRAWRLMFLLPEGGNSFVELLRTEVQALGPWLQEQRARAELRTTDAFSPVAAAAAILALKGQCDALVLMVQEHPLVRAAIEELVAAGICVVTLVSDVQARGRSHFVGIDNVAAGRTAANLLGGFCGQRSGPVGVVMGSRSLRDHADRLFGFRQVMEVEHPRLDLLTPLVGHDESARTEQLVADLLRQHPDLVGLYSIGAGNRGIHAALQSAGAAGRVIWVCHELTSHARRALLEGAAHAVINQDAAHEVRSACRVALAQLSRERLLFEQERIRIEIYLKDNLP